MRSLWNKRGFTLIEVLIALVILGLCGVVLVQTTQNSTNQSRYLANKVIATWIARDRVSELRIAIAQGQQVSLETQNVEQAGDTWSTQVRLSKQTEQLDRIEVDVFLSPDSTPIYSLSSYLPHLIGNQ